MKNNQIKLLAIAITFSVIAFAAFNTVLTNAVPINDQDVAAVYKSKCAACHAAKAEKFFDLAKTDEQLAEIILKGKKGAKPPAMPGFEASGMTKKQAEALVAYMRQLRGAPANTNANANTNSKTNANAGGNANTNVKTNTNANANANAKVNTNISSNANANTNVNANANASVSTNANTNTASLMAIAVIYKTKCAACHTAKAEKFFDPTKGEAEHIEIILNGKKSAKPPAMPEFGTKGITKEQAAALTRYMTSLRATGKP